MSWNESTDQSIFFNADCFTTIIIIYGGEVGYSLMLKNCNR